MNNPASIALALLTFAVGLHLPRSFFLLYIFSILTIALAQKNSIAISGILRISAIGRSSTILIFLFSVAYVSGMIYWHLWSWPADRLDLVNALLLPGLLFIAGFLSQRLGNLHSTRILLAYGVGSLLYALLSLSMSLSNPWEFGQRFISGPDILIPWGASQSINIRSLEQNVLPSIILLPAMVLLFACPGKKYRLPLFISFGILGLLGIYAVWLFESRIGWLLLVLASLPLVILVFAKLFCWIQKLKSQPAPFIFVTGFLLSLAASSQLSQLNRQLSKAFGFFCDERLILFREMLIRLHEAPWGGRLLRVPFHGCGGKPYYLLAAENGNIHQAHNVLYDIYFNVGLLPTSLLIAFLALTAYGSSSCAFYLLISSSWQDCYKWGWICLVFLQWTFQPLLYSDGILYYFSFFVPGILLSNSVGFRGRFANMD